MESFTTLSRYGSSVEIIVRWKKMEKSVNYPRGVSFAVMGRLRHEDGWREMNRVDNAPHHTKGTHIHYARREKVVLQDFQDHNEIGRAHV